MNLIIQSSINKNIGFSSVLDHKGGKLVYSSINISDSSFNQASALSIRSPFSLSIVNYSNFENLSSSTLASFMSYEETHQFSFCNIIDNKIVDTQDYLGIFCVWDAIINVYRCYFKGNKAYDLIAIFPATDGTLSASECYFESDNTFITNAEYIHRTIDMKEIVLKDLYSTFLCEVKYKKISKHIPFLFHFHILLSLVKGRKSLYLSL